MSAALRQAAEAIVDAVKRDPKWVGGRVLYCAEDLERALAASAAEEERARAAVDYADASMAYDAACEMYQFVGADDASWELESTALDAADRARRDAESQMEAALARYRALKEPADA